MTLSLWRFGGEAASLGFGLLCAVSISVTSTLLVLGDAGNSFLLFFVHGRVVVCALQLLAFFALSLFSLGLRGSLRLFLGLVRLSFCWPVLLSLLGALDGLMFVGSGRWVHPSLGVALFESWPALLVLLLALLPATRRNYLADMKLLLPGLLAVYLGVVLLMGGYAGGLGLLLADTGSAGILLGGGVALGGSLLGAFTMVGSVLWVWRVRGRLPGVMGAGFDVAPASVTFQAIFFLMFISSLPPALLGVLLLPPSLPGWPPVAYGLFLFFGMLSSRMVNVLGRSLVSNAVIYLGAPLGILWLVLTVGAEVGGWGLFLLGMGLVVGVNLLLQSVTWLRARSAGVG